MYISKILKFENYFKSVKTTKFGLNINDIICFKLNTNFSCELIILKGFTKKVPSFREIKVVLKQNLYIPLHTNENFSRKNSHVM